MTSTPRSLLLAEQTGRSWSTKNKNRFQCAALAAYRAEMAEAEMKAARAVRDALLTKSAVGVWATDGALREIIEKSKKDAG